MKLRIIRVSFLLLNVFCCSFQQHLRALQLQPETGTVEQNWRSITSMLKRGGYSAPQIKILLTVLQKAGIQVKDIHGEQQILELAKTITEKFKNIDLDDIDETVLGVFDHDPFKEDVTIEQGNHSYKWKVIAGICAGIAVAAVIFWYYEYCEEQRAIRERKDTERLLYNSENRERSLIDIRRNNDIRIDNLLRQSRFDAYRVEDLEHQAGDARNRIQTLERFKNQVPSRVYANNVCAVCQSEGGERSVLSCGHTLHNSCAQPWVNAHHNCPECRRPTSITSQVVVVPNPSPETIDISGEL